MIAEILSEMPGLFIFGIGMFLGMTVFAFLVALTDERRFRKKYKRSEKEEQK